MKKNPQTDALVVMKALEKEAKPQMRKVSNLEIKTQEDFDTAGKLLKNVKELAKGAKAREESITKPLTKVIADVRDLFRPFLSSVKELEEDTKTKMLAFANKADEKKEKLMKDFQEGKIKNVQTVVSKTNALEIENGDAKIKKVWTAVCVDEKKTPREYLVPDEVKIKEALKAGKKVPGWEWRQEKSIAI